MLADLPAPDRLRILTAVTETFVARGYAATTVAHLQTEIDPLAFDLLFEDTEDCFLQVYDQLIDQATGLISAALSAQDAWPQRLADGLAAVLELIEANPTAARFLLLVSQTATPEVTAHHMATITSLARFMLEGRALSDDAIPPILDSALPGGVAYILGSHLSTRPSEPIADLYPELLRILLLPYLGDTATTAFLATRPTGAPHA
jgi:AcrR family transcriptional regulator